MADDRYRRTGSTNATPASPGARRSPVSPAAPRQPGPDPLVELARLIGQNETVSYEPARPAARQRRASEIADQNAPAEGPASYAPPYARAPERGADRSMRGAERARGADQERHSDQPYDRYAEPKPAAAPPIPRRAERAEPAAARSEQPPSPPQRRQPPARPSEQVERAPSQPAEPAWRPPRTKARTPPPAAYPADDEDYASAYQDDRATPVERVAPRASGPVLPRASEGRRAPAPPREDYPSYEHAGVEAAAPNDYRDYYDEHGATAAEGGGEPGYDDYGYGGRDYEASYRPGRRKLWLAAALLLLAVVGTAGAYGLRAMLSGPSGEAAAPPVIRADSSPKKIAASQSGDKQIQDRLGDRGAGERLVPREEQPVTIKDPGAPALPPVGRPAEPPPVVAAPATTAATVVRPSGSQPAPAAPAAEPKRIKTVTIRPEGQQDDAAPPPAASARTTAPAPAAPPRAVRPATPVAPGGEPMSITPQAAPAPAPRSQTALAAPPPRTSTGDYVVQLSAQKSESDAQASFRAMQAKYPSVLSGRQPLIRRKDLGAKGVYFGAQVGPFASQSEASQLCEQLKAAGGTCIVQRN